jgi:hypothetical protein
MARKTRKKSAAKTKKKRKAPAKKKSKVAARKKPARKAKSKTKPKPTSKPKRKGIVATIVADFKAVVATLTDAEQLHKKLEPRGSPESES